MKINQLIKKSGDPELAQRQWDQIKGLIPPDLHQHPSSFFHLLGNSRFLIQHFLQAPQRFEDLLIETSLTERRNFEDIRRDADQAVSGTFDIKSAQRALRRFKYREMMRIAIRDFAGLASFEETGQDLSTLACALSRAALQAAWRCIGADSQNPFSIIGLGKLGGEDLNFSSDIDILYLYGVPVTKDEKDLENLFETSARCAEIITRLLNEPTEDGIVFRVDLDLRPQGKSGPLVNSIESIETYYEVAGAPWERMALLKAWPIAGDTKLAESFLKTIEPFVFRRSLDTQILQDIKAMKEKINAQLLSHKNDDELHVKLGHGGIREIEFFVASFQLVYGGRDIALHERNTLRALDLLAERNLISREDHCQLRPAYIFLRTIENRLQMVDDRQMHRIPSDAQELSALSRRMGFKSADSFLHEVRQTMKTVSSYFEKLAG